MRNSKGQFIKGSRGFWLGKKRKNLLKTNATKTMFKSGSVPWNKGKKLPYKPRPTRRGKRVSIDTEFKYKNGSGWSVVLHNWVKKNLGRPQMCQMCGSKDENRTYQWANKSGEYKKELTDWLRLCRRCHHKYDNISVKTWNTRKKK